jgi:hypothetical protein
MISMAISQMMVFSLVAVLRSTRTSRMNLAFSNMGPSCGSRRGRREEAGGGRTVREKGQGDWGPAVAATGGEGNEQVEDGGEEAMCVRKQDSQEGTMDTV